LLTRRFTMTELPLRTALGGYEAFVRQGLERLEKEQVMSRIWAHDHTVWSPDPEEITNRLGWLHVAAEMLPEVPELGTFADSLRGDGYANVLLLGMGGSSLASEVFCHILGVADGYLDSSVLDSTDPGAVLACAAGLDPAHTLFVVASKSGTTAETLAGFRFFYNRALAAVGQEHAGEHFVAITDPGTPLVKLARDLRFRHAFQADPNLGGRYSALSHFGMVNAALIGADIRRLLQGAQHAADRCAADVAAAENPAAHLGTVLGVLASHGRDKLTWLASPRVAHFGAWVEQLIAESTGKSGKGIVPLVREPLANPEVYGQDRLFVTLEVEGQPLDADSLQALEKAGHPLVRMRLRDTCDLGSQMFLWELATAVAGYHLGIQPFNQPNVESAKARAREAIRAYENSGSLPEAAASEPSPEEVRGFLAQARSGDYVALQAWLTPSLQVDSALQGLRLRLRDRTRLAVTCDFGPRFLHSTGQLHKGDRGNGLFIQLTADDIVDVPIPDQAGSGKSSMTFGVLKEAQAQGDFRALRQAGRRVIRFHLNRDILSGLATLSEGLH
jgi:transaldolase/glucose-6-phosphate isomerase